MTDIDLNAPATLEFRPDWREQRLQGPGMIRFETVAEAIKFALESRDTYRLSGAVLRTNRASLTFAEMTAIYEGPDFPLSKAPKGPG